MKDQTKFDIVFNIFLAIFITLFVTIFIQAAGGTLTAEHLIIGLIQGFCLNFCLETFIDLPGLGNRFCMMVGIKDLGGKAAYFVRILAIVFVLVLLMTLILMFCEIGFSMGAGFFGFWLSKVPAIFVVAYITAIVFFVPCLKMTQAFCKPEN